MTLGGPSLLGLSFSRSFYYDWKMNEWANLFRFCGSADICQVLASRPHGVLSLCVEELGDMIRAGGK